MLSNKEEKDVRGTTFYIRQALIVVFTLLTIVGIVIWFNWSQEVGAYTLIAAVVVKFVEVTMRLMNI